MTVVDTRGPEARQSTAGPVSLALVVSGLRCLCTYVLLPGLAPVVGSLVTLAIPLVLALYALGIGAAGRAVVRCGRDGRVVGAMFAGVLVLLNLASLTALLG